jgi:hypothetical protein
LKKWPVREGYSPTWHSRCQEPPSSYRTEYNQNAQNHPLLSYLYNTRKQLTKLQLTQLLTNYQLPLTTNRPISSHSSSIQLKLVTFFTCLQPRVYCSQLTCYTLTLSVSASLSLSLCPITLISFSL